MKLAKGEARTVFVFENFVVKISKLHLRRTVEIVWESIRRGYLRKCLGWGIYTYCSPRRLLFLGIMENWREFIFYLFNRSPFLMPTYFSLFGIINIQEKGEVAKIETVDLWCQLAQMTNHAVNCCGHHFANPGNFCNENGHLKIFDYGNPKVQEVVKQFGDKIYREFDFAYKYNKDEETE
jgi:hypothetical protein